MIVSPGTVVSVEYTLRLDEEDEVYESNVGDAPLVYTHGAHEIIPGLEDGLDGMVVGQTKRVTVSPADGYGDRLDEGMIEVSRSKIPAEALEVGTKLEATTPDGKTVFPRIADIKENTVVLDLNHPLAGKTLYFEVTVLDIQPGSVT